MLFCVNLQMSGAKQEPHGEGSGEKASEVCRQRRRDGVAGADDAGGAKVDGDGVKGGFCAAQHDGGHPADVAVGPVGGHQITGNGQCAAAGYGADQHQRHGLRRDAQKVQNRGAQPGQRIHGTGGPEHTDGGE